MSNSNRKNKRQLVLLSGVFCAQTLAADLSPISTTQPITLNNGDRVIHSTIGDVIGVNSSSVSTEVVGPLTVNGAAAIEVTGTTNTTTTSAKATGIHLVNHSGLNNFGNGSSIKVEGNTPIDTVEVNTVSGVEVLGSGTVLTAGSLAIDAKNNNTLGGAVGVRAQSGGTVTLTGNNVITVVGGASAGTGVSAGLKAANQKNDASTITNTIKVDQVTITATNGMGAYADAHSTIDLGQGSVITTIGDNSNGIVAMNVGSVTGTGVTVKTSGTTSAAILARGGGNIDIYEGSHVETAGSFGVYINANKYNDPSGQATNSTLDYIGTDANRNTIITNDTHLTPRVAAVFSQGTGAILTIAKTDITTKGAYGLRVDSNGGVINGTDLTIKTERADNATASIFAVYATNSGKVSLTGNTIIQSDNGIGSALFADKSTIDITGKVNIKGNIDAFLATGKIDINATAGSVFEGHSLTEQGGTVNIAMTDSVWNMDNSSAVADAATQQKESTVTNLTLNNSTVNFIKLPNDTLGNPQFAQLTANTLNGNATFNMTTDIVGQKGDLLVVEGTVSGNHKLGITNSGSAATNGTETLTVVKTGITNTPMNNFSLANKVELGAYEYGLRAVAGSPNNLELYSSGKSGGSSGTLTTTAEAAGSFLNIGYLTNYIENQTLLQRLGDLRNNEYGTAKQDGFWVKGFGGKLNSFAGHALKGFDMTYTGTQLGIDKSFDVNNGRLLVGAMAGFTDTNPNYRKGDGSGKNYTAGLYTTYLLDNGFYVDNVLKFNRMRNQFNVKDTAGSAVKGKAKTHGVSFSTEIGKRFWLEGKNQGFYLEPQAQLSYGYQTGDTVKASNGLRVGLSHYNSTLGRVSGIVGYQTQGDTPVSVYLKTGIVREMSGGASYRFNDGDKKGHSFRSNWFDNGIGVDVNINKKHNIYAEADYATGNQFDNAKLNLGYRYSF